MTTTTHHETTIEAPSDVPLIRIVREFDAPVARVFRAHVDPALVVQWLGPRRLTMRVESYDARRGGHYRYVHSGESREEHWFYGSFHEVVTDERIVQTFTYEGWPEGVALETLRFEDLGEGRTRLSAESLCASFESRDSMVASGMEEGIVEGYERLDDLLAGEDQA